MGEAIIFFSGHWGSFVAVGLVITGLYIGKLFTGKGDTRREAMDDLKASKPDVKWFEVPKR